MRVVPELLRLFGQYDVRATWAIVGGIACKYWTDYFRRAPAPPRYSNRQFALDPRCSDIDPDGRLHFAPGLVDLIAFSSGQEVGTHTLSHLFLGEAGVSADDVAADLAAAVRIQEERIGTAPVSLVFPRNQCAFLDIVRQKES